MYLRTLTFLAVLTTLCGSSLAASAEVASVDGLVELLQDMGHDVVEEAADDGPNLVIDDGKWSISLSDCSDRTDCRYGWVYARRELDKYVSVDCANDWNTAEPFGTAWIDGVSQPWLVTTLNLQGNPGEGSVRSTLEWYTTQLASFEEYVQTCPAVGKDKS